MTDTTEQQQEPEREVRVWFDHLTIETVIQQRDRPAWGELRLNHVQRDVLVAALSNVHTARALLRPEDILAIGQNLYAIYMQQVADNMSEGLSDGL